MANANSDQRDFWSDAAGPKWLRFAGALDAMFQPVLDGVIARAGIEAGDSVLDIGCGTGASTLRLAEVVGPSGRVLGADISAPLLAMAVNRAGDHPHLNFIETDAQTHAFEPAQFDHLVSRFGVMFFDGPATAFANMARGLKPGARVSFAAWGQIAGNPFFTYAAQAARGILGSVPKSDPDLPGPFAFRDPERVLAIFDQAGLQHGRCDTAQVMLTPAGDLSDFVDMLLSIGPADAAITHFDADAAQIDALRAMLRDVFAQFDGPEGLSIPAEINFYGAEAA